MVIFVWRKKYLRFYLAVTKRLLIFATVKTENIVLKQGRDDIKPRNLLLRWAYFYAHIADHCNEDMADAFHVI